MRLLSHRSQYSYQPSDLKIRLLPLSSVMLCSMSPTLPLILSAPVSPPWGFMMFITWKLLQPDIWYPWAGALLGLYDDMWSGQPLGSGMLLWALTQIALNTLDRYTASRDFRQNWIAGTACIIFLLTTALFLANHSGGHTLWAYIVPQILFAALTLPLVMRLCAWQDQWRFR